MNKSDHKNKTISAAVDVARAGTIVITPKTGFGFIWSKWTQKAKEPFTSRSLLL